MWFCPRPLRVSGSNGHVTYGGVTEEGFVINPVTGVITTTKELDKELQDHYTLTGTTPSALQHFT